MLKKLPKLQNGFTLIELLVVIAIIGILAIVLIFAINPIEVIRKTQDTGYISDAKQLNDGLSAFYANNGCYPWNWTTGTGCSGSDGFPATLVTAPSVIGDCSPTDTSVVGKLVTQGDLKQDFCNKIKSEGVLTLYATPSSGDPRGYETITSFLPKSQAYLSKSPLYNDGTCSSIVGGGRFCLPGTNY